MQLRSRAASGKTAVLNRWGVDSEYGVLRDVLVGPIDNFRWTPGNAVAQRTERVGLKFDFAAARAQYGEMMDAYRQAEAELKHALELDDQNGDAYFYRGEALNQLSRVDDALEMLERAVQFQPGNARAYYTMGILYDRKHLRQEATTMYRKAREVGAA